jgi:hypothetical protein
MKFLLFRAESHLIKPSSRAALRLLQCSNAFFDNLKKYRENLTRTPLLHCDDPGPARTGAKFAIPALR